MPIDLRTPMVFAHRGFKSIAPENTIPAFQKAVDIGADGIELDVQLSLDGKIMVIHDGNLDRTTNGAGKVSDHPFTSLTKLDAGSWFSKEFKDVSIPTLEEVFTIIPKEILINVELKSSQDQIKTLPNQVAKLVNGIGNQDQILISSFNLEMIKEIKCLLPNIKIGLLAKPSILGCKTRNKISNQIEHDALHPYYRDVSSKLIKRYNDQGKRIHTYTVNDEKTMRRLYIMGVHGIFTDYADTALKVRAEVGL